MNISNFPNGFANGVTIRGMPIVVTNPGETFWVDSVRGSNGNKGTFARPFATIDYAIGRCTASRGDIVFVKPGHVETVTAAGGIACDVAGVAVVGLGRGTLRPTITLTTAATASVTVTAANVTLHNMRMVAGFADITRIIDVTATDALIDAVEFVQSAADLNWVDCIDASGGDNTANGLTVSNCRAFGIDAANDSFIEITGDIDRMTVEGNLVVHTTANATALIEQATGKNITAGMIRGNAYYSGITAVDILVDNDTAVNTGFAIGNYALHADTAGEILIDADGLGLIENRGTGVVTASGYVLPALDS